MKAKHAEILYRCSIHQQIMFYFTVYNVIWQLTMGCDWKNLIDLFFLNKVTLLRRRFSAT